MSQIVDLRHSVSQYGEMAVDEEGNIVLAIGTAVPADGAAGYAKGCLFFDKDADAGDRVWVNDGTASAADFNKANMGTASGQVVNVTTSTLTVTEALHNGKTMVLDLAAGIAVTLPAAKAGLDFTFIVKTTFTGAASIKSATGADVMVGGAILSNDSDNAIVRWPALAASTLDTIDLFGTANSTGGIAGQIVKIRGLAANLWHVEIFGDAAGTEATPFADTVA